MSPRSPIRAGNVGVRSTRRTARSTQLSLSRLWYTGSPMKGGTTYGQSTVYRCAGPPHRVSGFHEFDPGGISDAGPALRGGVPGAHGRVASRWKTTDRSPVHGVQE